MLRLSFSIALCGTLSLASADEMPLAEEHDLGHDEAHGHHGTLDDSIFADYTGADASIAGFLFPSLHVLGAFGATTGEQSELAVNDHDPQADATLQGLEPGLSLMAGNLQGFANATGITNSEGDFSFTLEEGFLKLVDLPLGLELRGGQYLNRFGFQNAVHNHGWSFVDQNLVNGRFLNEGELISQGGEVSWNVPLNMMQASILSVSVGGLASHSHGHEHGEEDHHDEPEFEAEGAEFVDQVISANWVNQYDINDMNRLTGIVAGAWGDNEFGRTTQVYSAGLEYLWRENGYGAGGRSFRWRTEVMVRDVEARSGHLHDEDEEEHDHEHEEEHGHEEDHHDDHDEDHHDDHDDDHHDDHEEDHHDEEIRYASFDEFGAYTQLIYGFNDQWEAGVRGEWVSGISEFGLDNRWRVSPMVTFYANPARTLQARLQYNYDHSNDFGSEHSIWFQVGLNWGGTEVR